MSFVVLLKEVCASSKFVLLFPLPRFLLLILHSSSTSSFSSLRRALPRKSQAGLAFLPVTHYSIILIPVAAHQPPAPVPAFHHSRIQLRFPPGVTFPPTTGRQVQMSTPPPNPQPQGTSNVAMAVAQSKAQKSASKTGTSASSNAAKAKMQMHRRSRTGSSKLHPLPSLPSPASLGVARFRLASSVAPCATMFQLCLLTTVIKDHTEQI